MLSWSTRTLYQLWSSPGPMPQSLKHRWTETQLIWTLVQYQLSETLLRFTYLLYNNIGPQDNKEPQKISNRILCLKEGQPWGETRLLRALSTRFLKASKDAACTASPDNQLHCLIVLEGKKFFLTSRHNLPSFNLRLLPVFLPTGSTFLIISP